MKLSVKLRHFLQISSLGLCLCGMGPASAEPLKQEGDAANRSSFASASLEEIEQLKTDIIELNAEFKQLEQDQLYPASVDTALFVSVDTGQYFQLEAIEARVDDQPVIGHFYTDKQRGALEKGGIHKLSQIHVKPGQHQLVITVIGKTPDGQSIKRGITHDFEKTKDSLGLELQLFDSLKNLSMEMRIKTWSL